MTAELIAYSFDGGSNATAAFGAALGLLKAEAEKQGWKGAQFFHYSRTPETGTYTITIQRGKGELTLERLKAYRDLQRKGQAA